MGVTKPSVTKALASLAQKGLVDVVDRDARLTSEGHRLAEEALAKHLFFEEMLLDAGVDAEVASEEVCRWSTAYPILPSVALRAILRTCGGRARTSDRSGLQAQAKLIEFGGACKPSAITTSRRLAGLSARVGSVRVVSGSFDACPFAMGWHPAMHLPAETKRLLDDSEEPFGFYAKLCGHAAHRCGGSEMSSSVAIGTARNRMKNTNRCSITILTRWLRFCRPVIPVAPSFRFRLEPSAAK